MQRYDHQQTEAKWQKRWEQEGAFRTSSKPHRKRKRYILDMFPYPSAAGLHVGHPEGYTATDIIARYERMNGNDVLHPMGWDAFGLPAENYAIKQGVHPAETTAKAIGHFRAQITSLGLSYDWDREVNTSDPDYYRWTQWLFLKLHAMGLAEKREAPVNWCEHDHTVLANEQVIDGKCERCGRDVVQKNLKQWFFTTTTYADELLEGLEKLDWPEPIKRMQENWIGKSEGADIDFSIQGDSETIKVFTTRPDTIFGATYMVLAPEHPMVERVTTKDRRQSVLTYQQQAAKKTELERKADVKEKTGVFTGGFAVNPATNEKIPIWIADYVMMGYGTGAIMAVPAHDERDFAFAKKYSLPVRCVIRPQLSGETREEITEREKRIVNGEECWEKNGDLINSGDFSGQNWIEAKVHIMKWLEKSHKASASTQYKLRDWLVSRQRYWGAPIPMILCETCGEVPVSEKELPVKLPDDVDFRPTGESPLARSTAFHKGVTCPSCGKPARREVDTMDTFVDSSWYFLRYLDPTNDKRPFDAKQVKAWMPVDLYVGGAEHAVLHLLYARFITKALRDAKELSIDEPFHALKNQGLILGEDNQKMSKSRGNVVNPDAIVEKYGADAMRLYEMFMGPFDQVKPWQTQGLVGMRRFLDRVWMLREKVDDASADDVTETKLHKTVKKVTEDSVAFQFNTAISAMMELSNHLQSLETIPRVAMQTFLLILNPFVPHITEELWEMLGFSKTIADQEWPSYDASKITEETVEFAVQVNGKVRGTITIAPDASEEDALAQALTIPNVKKFVTGDPKKVIYVAGKILNIVV